MNIDLKLDISKLSPAPWQVESNPLFWPLIISGPADDDNKQFPISGNDSLELPDMVMCAVARNFLEITMRRGWGVKKCSDGRWMVLHNGEVPVHVGLAGWPDPFTAVIETEKWLVANIEVKALTAT